MQYSLLSRFQGALLGSILGEALVSHSLASVKPSAWNEIAIDLMDAIVSGTLSQGDWQRIYHRYQRILTSKSVSNSGAIATAILPILLLFHENPQALSEQLQYLGELRLSNQTKEDVLIWGYAISLALREKLDTSDAIAQILSRYPDAQTSLIQHLKQVRVFLKQGIPLKQAVAQLTCTDKSQQSTMALAFYCTSDNWEDFRLCLMRAMHSGKQASLVVAMSGALAGAYNSLSAFPIQWRVATAVSSTGQQLLQKATQIAAIWSGVYEANDTDLFLSEAVSSPQVIQPRSSLKIISQGEYLSENTLFIVDDKVIKK